MKICFRCHKEIAEDSNYYSFTEFNSGAVVNINYAHRNCWDDFLKQVSNTDEVMNLMRGIKPKLIEMGMLPEEKMVVA